MWFIEDYVFKKIRFGNLPTALELILRLILNSSGINDEQEIILLRIEY